MAGRLRAADDLLGTAVQETLDALELSKEDKAAARLARELADTIDGADDRQEAMERLAPRLLAVLESLGATPAARARIRTGGGATRAESRLAALRAARRA